MKKIYLILFLAISLTLYSKTNCVFGNLKLPAGYKITANLQHECDFESSDGRISGWLTLSPGQDTLSNSMVPSWFENDKKEFKKLLYTKLGSGWYVINGINNENQQVYKKVKIVTKHLVETIEIFSPIDSTNQDKKDTAILASSF